MRKIEIQNGRMINYTQFKFFSFPVLPLSLKGAEKEKNLKILSMGLRDKKCNLWSTQTKTYLEY